MNKRSSFHNILGVCVCSDDDDMMMTMSMNRVCVCVFEKSKITEKINENLSDKRGQILNEFSKSNLNIYIYFL